MVEEVSDSADPGPLDFQETTNPDYCISVFDSRCFGDGGQQKPQSPDEDSLRAESEETAGPPSSLYEHCRLKA